MRRARHAFTLTELLTVIGIIGILLAVLLPAIGLARRSARDAACLANLHTWATAFQSYVSANGGRSVLARTDATGLTWFEQLRPYAGDVTRTLLCPAATVPGNAVGSATLAWGPDRTYVVADPVWSVRGTYAGSYGFNEWLGRLPAGHVDPPDALGYRLAPSAKSAADVPVIADCVLQSGLPLASDPVPLDLNTPIPPPGGGAVGVTGSMRYFCIDRHRRRVSVLMLDGHAEAVPLGRLWQLRWHGRFVGRAVTVP